MNARQYGYIRPLLGIQKRYRIATLDALKKNPEAFTSGFPTILKDQL